LPSVRSTSIGPHANTFSVKVDRNQPFLCAYFSGFRSFERSVSLASSELPLSIRFKSERNALFELLMRRSRSPLLRFQIAEILIRGTAVEKQRAIAGFARVDAAIQRSDDARSLAVALSGNSSRDGNGTLRPLSSSDEARSFWT